MLRLDLAVLHLRARYSLNSSDPVGLAARAAIRAFLTLVRPKDTRGSASGAPTRFRLPQTGQTAEGPAVASHAAKPDILLLPRTVGVTLQCISTVHNQRVNNAPIARTKILVNKPVRA